MPGNNQHWRNSRRIVERLVIEGDLELLTPAHFGGGDSGAIADLTLLRDAYAGRALMPGASIAGALRTYHREWLRGYGEPDENSVLFGIRREASDDDPGNQSLLIVDDAVGEEPQVELRDGVKIDPVTRTADEGKLFDVEVLRAGTQFPLRFELLVPEGKREELYHELCQALQGFERGEIGMGARKQRGYGRCQVKQWCVQRYDLTQADGLLAWLAAGQVRVPWEDDPLPDVWRDAATVPILEGSALAVLLANLLGVALTAAQDKRRRFKLVACFDLDGSLLVRSGMGEADLGADSVHLHRGAYQAPGRDITPAPVVPGTSIAGALRVRAGRIVATLAQAQGQAATLRGRKLVNELFGVGPEDSATRQDARASRLVVHESLIQNTHSLFQTRIRVDRFTGAAMDNYLFTEAPVFSEGGNNLELDLTLRNPRDEEIGLLLLLLKDLWTSDLALGGESSVGRGRLRGQRADLTHVADGQPTQWTITRDGDKLQVVTDTPDGDAWQSLENFVAKLVSHVAGGSA